jgi:hypothetical protein
MRGLTDFFLSYWVVVVGTLLGTWCAFEDLLGIFFFLEEASCVLSLLYFTLLALLGSRCSLADRPAGQLGGGGGGEGVGSRVCCPLNCCYCLLCPHALCVFSCWNRRVLILLYVSSCYYYVCWLLHICAHTSAAYVSSCYCICVLIFLCICPHTAIYVSVCVLILLYMCPHTLLCNYIFLFLGIGEWFFFPFFSAAVGKWWGAITLKKA